MQDATRDAGRQYALPLVIRVERAAPPARTDALEGAARAVLRFLSDPRVTQDDGEWAAAAGAWEDARIRKIVRRGLTKFATYRDDAGQLYVRSAACSHLGCHLHWNSFETCWDCPCHGSQFAVDGTAINAPAVAALTKAAE